LPQFSNQQGKEDTLQKELPYFLTHPAEDFLFVKGFCGAILARGWATETKWAAVDVGLCLLLALAATVVYGIIHWRDEALRGRLIPMFCLALYTPLTGTMVAVGRVYHGGLGVAMNMRYTVHQTALFIGLVGMAFFIARHAATRLSEPVRRSVGGAVFAVGGVLLGVISVGWIYGSSMMQQWAGARCKDAAAQRYSQLFPDYNHFVGHVAGNFHTSVDAIADLAKYKMLKPAPLTDRTLSNAHYVMNPNPLPAYHGLFQRLWKEPDGTWHAKGHTSLPGSFRTADAVLFTYRVPGGEWTIFGFTQAEGVPDFLPHSMGKDLWGIRRLGPWLNEITCPWEDELALVEEPPAGSRIIAWSVDVRKNELRRIRRHVNKDSDEKQPSEDPDGDPIESLSTFVDLPIMKDRNHKHAAAE